jgi:hypothetical protein
MNFPEAEQFIKNLLHTALPANLYYHDIEHTMDVYSSALRIAESENIHQPGDLLLLKTAALYHDSGFTRTYRGHEDEGCRIAQESLPAFNYSNQEIEKICSMILATRIPQQPVNILEKILCDADLDYLGRDDFKKTGNKLYREWMERGMIRNEQEWNEIQAGFLSSHHYWTETSIHLRSRKKEKHLLKIKKLLESD